MTRDSKYISEEASWDFKKLEEAWLVIEDIAKSKFNLDFYPAQIEIISSEQMLDAYSSVAMPIMYNHWSFGKQFVREQEMYMRGRMGLAFEVVSNTSPCIAYLMEENTMCMQMLVLSHACVGHNSFFKNNYLFKEWTDAETIIDYLSFAKSYITECEEKYGQDEVEKILDSCHALMQYGVFKYKRPEPVSIAEEKHRQQERIKHQQEDYNELWKTIPRRKGEIDDDEENFPPEPEENILYFIEKHAPHLDDWKREIIRIVRNMSQYWYPQQQTKLLNEGFATHTHYTIMNELYDQGYINEAYMLEFIESHTAVTNQLEFDDPYFNGINVYALGFAMLQDVKRICIDPTDEDKEWFPDFAGNNDWVTTIDYIMKNFRDESFVQQYLSPKIMRDFKLFAIVDDDDDTEIEVSAIHNEQGYKKVRNTLADQYNVSENSPNIQVFNVNVKGDRTLTLQHYQHNKIPIDPISCIETLKHVMRLWEYPVELKSIDPLKTYADDKEFESCFTVDKDKVSAKF